MKKNLFKKLFAFLTISALTLTMTVCPTVQAAVAEEAKAKTASEIIVHSVRDSDGKYTQADVNVYQIATCYPDGTWEWLGDFANNPPTLQVTHKNPDTNTVTVTAKVVFSISYTPADVLNESNTFTNEQTTVQDESDTSYPLQILASKLTTEQVIELSNQLKDTLKNDTGNTVLPAKAKELNKKTARVINSETGEESYFTDDTKTTSLAISLPNYDEAAHDKLATNVGYYLIVTELTDVVIQPTLEVYEVPDTSTKTAYITPKSNAIPLTKKIKSIKDLEADISEDQEKNISERKAKTTGEISETGTTSYAADESWIEYEIVTRTPKYAPDVEPKDDFVIIDDPDDSLSVDLDTVNVTIEGIGEPVFKDNVVEMQLEAIKNGEPQNPDGAAYFSISSESSDGFTVTFDKSYIAHSEVQDRKVTVTFKANLKNSTVYGNASSKNNHKTLKKDAENTREDEFSDVKDTGNVNRVQVTYPNEYSTGSGFTEHHTSVTTYVGKLQLEKYGSGNNTEQLSGAKFQLYQLNTEQNKYEKYGSEFTTETVAHPFGYLPEGTYKLEETEAPTNYTAVGEYIFTVKVKDNNATEYSTYEFSTEGDAPSGVELQYYNGSDYVDSGTSLNKGDAKLKITDPKVVNLPGLGGMGTTMIVGGGAAGVGLAITAFFVLVKKRKMALA